MSDVEKVLLSQERERAEAFRLKDVNADLLAACNAAVAYIPPSEVRSWPPGFGLKKKAMELLNAAIAKAGAK